MNNLHTHTDQTETHSYLQRNINYRHYRTILNDSPYRSLFAGLLASYISEE